VEDTVKKPEMYRRCEFCDKKLLDVSPPTREQYAQSMIQIEDGSVLLPRETNGTNARYFDGVYCGPACLFAHISALVAEASAHEALK